MMKRNFETYPSHTSAVDVCNTQIVWTGGHLVWKISKLPGNKELLETTIVLFSIVPEIQNGSKTTWQSKCHDRIALFPQKF